MSYFEKAENHREIVVYANAENDLGSIWADRVSVKHAYALSEGTEWLLFPSGETWYQFNGDGTHEAAPIPVPPAPPGDAAIVGSAIVGTSVVG